MARRSGESHGTEQLRRRAREAPRLLGVALAAQEPPDAVAWLGACPVAGAEAVIAKADDASDGLPCVGF